MIVAKNHPSTKPLVLNISNTALHLSPEQLERLQIDNPDLKLELAENGKLLLIPLTTINEQVEASTVEEVSSQGSISMAHSTSSGTYQLPELSAEETARRVGMIERHQARRQEIIDSMTPEELEASNQQFDDMFKILEESRR
jgi:hypothetical protein